ncbi:hypothetical protein EST38_g10921 [Candolleomyces aberdarensis]|uniref:(4-O-methyl)-D-glucuronate--lignin esterase n=1 Tax=Candolleomyces aberdarensis TaxID=2316362 RepID=A0A4Q2D653_9AGAR|nr:hypothetical protein EST38_g10921 [Candolleomyces aberdarensis]
MVSIFCLFAFLAVAGVTLSQPDAGADRCPTLPDKLILSKLTDPFTFFNKRPVRTKADWACRRAELAELIQRFQVGYLPSKPPTSVAGELLENGVFNVTVTEGEKSITYPVQIRLPAEAEDDGPFPAIISLAGLNIPTPPGVAVISVNNDLIASQVGGISRGTGLFYDLYGKDHSAGALIAWTWGVGRLIDALEKVPSAKINTKRLAVTGCSRNGKGAMVIGAFEPRIRLTIPQESGAGGAACWRISDDLKTRGNNTQTASQIVQENVWLGPAFNSYTGQVGVLPFDQHLLTALIAPRAVLVEDNGGIDWLGPESVYGCQRAARTVWRALGVADHIGLSQPPGHNHCQLPEVSKPYVNAFIDRFLKDKEDVNTTVFYTGGDFKYDEKDWVDWDVPRLR